MKKTLRKIIPDDNFLLLTGNVTITFFGFADFALLTRTFQVDLFGRCFLYITVGTVAAVALYSTSMKLTELQQIPLRSFSETAFPKMSKASMNGETDEVKSIFYTYSGIMTYLFSLISLITFIFADFFVLILGGSQYMGTDPITGFNAANIVRVFSIYGILLPIDRMTGVGLDRINKPDKNLIKVSVMAFTNIIDDLIAVFFPLNIKY